MDALSFFNVAEGDTAARPAVPTLLFAPPPAAVPFYLPRSPPRLSLVRLAVSGTLNWPLRLSWSAAGKKTADAFVSEGSERMGDVRDSAAETSWRNRASSLLHIGYLWSEKKAGGGGNGDSGESGGVGEDGAERRRCECCGADQKNGFCEDWEGGEVEKFDGSTFPRYLKRVSLEEAKLYAQMSYLGNLAYSIRNIKPGSLVLKYHRLQFITSSLKKRELIRGMNIDSLVKSSSSRTEKNYVERVNEGTSANDTECGKKTNVMGSDIESFMANTSSVTVMVAAEEETKRAVAEDLNSVHSSTCEWFICDEKHTRTRLFVIQGSESVASWQANLLFEPVQFEGLDVLVHRGIYEAAKGIYDQILPEVLAQLKSHRNSARLRFTGHSLGGSLALLVNLMLLIRGEAPRSSLLPVVTFGSPSIMYGGDNLLVKLGLPRSHVQAITMHHDIVPRTFSCNYPDHVARILKAVNRNFRNHPCLKYQKTLYTPTGELLILQPDDKLSPEHHFLPPGTGLYRLCGSHESASSVTSTAHKLKVAVMAFLNSPHPLDMLRSKSAYGSEGTIYKHHDMISYAHAVRYVMRLELIRLKEQRKYFWWPLLVAVSQFKTLAALVYALHPASLGRVSFAGLMQMGRNSFWQISSNVAAFRLPLVLLLIPVRFSLFKLLRIEEGPAFAQVASSSEHYEEEH